MDNLQVASSVQVERFCATVRPLPVPPMSEPAQTTNPIAIAALVSGALSILCICGCYGFPFNLLGLVLGGVAVVQSNGDPSVGGKPLAFAGIGLSVLSFLIVFGLIVLGFGAGMMGAILDQM